MTVLSGANIRVWPSTSSKKKLTPLIREDVRLGLTVPLNKELTNNVLLQVLSYSTQPNKYHDQIPNNIQAVTDLTFVQNEYFLHR